MPFDETDRLQVLRSYAVLDTPPDPALDRITGLARLAFGMPMAILSLIDHDRQQLKSHPGLDVCEMAREHAFCAHALPLPRGSVLTVEDAAADPRFAANPLVTGEPHIRFYAGAVLTSPEGANLGALCVIDTRPRGPLTPLEHQTLRALADMAMSELDVQRTRRADSSKQRMLGLAESMSGVGHWRLEVATGAVSWSDEVYRIHGLDRATFDPTLGDALEVYHPDDRPVVAEHVAAAVRDGTGYAYQLRVRRSDGAWREVSCKAAVERDAAGKVIAVMGVFQDVTEQQALLRQVSEERERYRFLADSSLDVIARYDMRARFTYLSPSIARLTGQAPEDLLGCRTYDVMHPDDHARVAAEFAAFLAEGGASARVEYRALHRDGSWTWVEAHPKPVLDEAGRLVGFHDVVRDVSARRAAQEAAAEAAARTAEALARAQKSEARYRLLAENANDMIALTSTEDSRIQFVSPGCRRVLGYEPGEIVGRRTLGLTHPDDVGQVLRHFGALLAAGPTEAVAPYQFRGRHKDGSWRWLEGQPRVLWGDDGRPTCFQDVVRDITQRKQMEWRLESLRDAAEAGARAKTDFLANMSHELRTPLTGILGYADLLAAAPELAEDSRRHLERMRRSGETLLGLVNDVMDLSKIEAGHLDLRARPTDLAALLAGAADSVWPQARAKDLVLHADLPDAPVEVLVDPDRLRQVVLNLLGNAVKFTDRGEVRLSLAAEPTAEGDRLAVSIAVADTGIGLPADQLARVFGRFEQADASITRRFGGSGLGLAISRAIVDGMGGRLAAASEPGRGSTFSVTLEAPVAPAAERTAPVPEAHADLAPLAGRRVLLAEDVAINRELITLLLARCRLSLTCVENGAEAVEAAAREPFDVVLMDMQMPVMDGVEAARRIRASGGPNADTPIVALTANVLPSEVAVCRAAGMGGHVAKPFTVGSLTGALAAAVAQPRPREHHGPAARTARA